MNASRNTPKVGSGMMGCLSPLVTVALLALLATGAAARWHPAKNANGCGSRCVDVQASS
jgi:hypothetical protein